MQRLCDVKYSYRFMDGDVEKRGEALTGGMALFLDGDHALVELLADAMLIPEQAWMKGTHKGDVVRVPLLALRFA